MKMSGMKQEANEKVGNCQVTLTDRKEHDQIIRFEIEAI